MSVLDAVAVVVHQLFAALWIGTVVFVALAVLPLARDGTIAPDPLDTIAGRALTVSRLSALALLASGAHVLYWNALGAELALEPLLESGRGHLVLAMVGCWLALATTVEIGTSRLRAGLDRGKLREPAHEALPWYRAAAVIALLVAVLAGLLGAGVGV